LKPSKYQIDFWDAIEHTNDNIIVQAAAGSGKTTSLVGGLEKIPKYKKTIFLAFSKNIQLELQDRLPNHIDCMTLHSLGYKSIWNHFKTKIKLDQYKNFKFAESIVKELRDKGGNPLSHKDQMIYKFTMSDLIDMARITQNISLDGFKNVEKQYDIFCKNGEVENAMRVFEKIQLYNIGRQKIKSIDFTDMVYLPVALKMELPKYDYVAVDEIQDLNATQHELVSKLLKPNGRIIGVGDNFQSIFGFQGALSNSMDIMKDKFNMAEYPLSVTYRVPKSGVELLKEINPNIECPDNAIEGSVRYGSLSEVQLGDLVISRNTKPLIIAYFNLIAQEKKATIVGKEFESGLSKLINKFDGMNIKTAKHCIKQEKQYIEEQLKDQGITEPKKHFKYVSFKEKTDVLEIFLDKYDSISLVKSKISDIFNENKEGIKLMTVHKSKGLESDRVFFITHLDGVKLIPSKYAKSDEQKQQETNLKYVAMSRHKKDLIFVKLKEND
jgi:DNA helicase II / ATP-dependent DNA helicase PcrA